MFLRAFCEALGFMAVIGLPCWGAWAIAKRWRH